jgi:hypothetical protein
MTGKFDTIKDINITENGVHKLLKNLNPNKAECKVPSDLRGGICFPSDLCFIKVQNLFIQFGVSFVWSLSGGETILSMYFQYA